MTGPARARRAVLLGAAAFAMSAAASGALAPGAQASVDGIWGVANGEDVNCKGLVMVLRQGAYQKVMLDLGTTKGLRDSVFGTSRYTISGDRIEIEPSLSYGRPEPRQIFRWDPVSGTLRRAEPTPTLLFRRCPDRPLKLMER
ncbi:MAG: hypothetical protein HQ481_11225 [Alphaproteobacteria bacterium]|nr:hypothetical protein [Alphaproteobacteria bacterium]